MSIFEEVKEFIVRNCRTRNASAPSTESGVILYDGDGAERLVFRADPQRQNKFDVASVADFQAFIRDIGKRYPSDKDKYRELTIKVDGTDTPVTVTLSIPHDDPRDGRIDFHLRPHEDFQRWFDGKYRTQTEFRKMLIELDGQHDCQNLATALTFLEYKTEVTFEASAETERNYVLGYKEKEAKSGLNIPKIINVKCPVISGTAYITEVAFDILIRKPKQEDPRIMFALSPAGKDPRKILREASVTIVENELLIPAVETLKANGVEIVAPLYVRDNVHQSVYDATKNNHEV